MGIAHLVAFLFYLVAMSLPSRGIGASLDNPSTATAVPLPLHRGGFYKDEIAAAIS